MRLGGVGKLGQQRGRRLQSGAAIGKLIEP
jgi:hypothetical protein